MREQASDATDGDPGDLARESHEHEYIACITHPPASGKPGNPLARPPLELREIDSRRRVQKLGEAALRGEAEVVILSDDELPAIGLADPPQRRGRGRPARPLPEAVKLAANAWRGQIKPWIALIWTLDEYSGLPREAGRRLIFNAVSERRKAERLPPEPQTFPLPDPTDSNRRIDLGVLIDWYVRLRQEFETNEKVRDYLHERPIEWITDRIVRGAFSPKHLNGLEIEDGIPAHGNKPLRHLLRHARA